MSEHTPSDGLTLDEQLCFAVYSTAHAFTAAYKPALEPLGLTYPQYLVLMILWEKDGVAVKDIGKKLFLDSGTLTPLLKRLEKAGFVRRQRDSADERVVRIFLTDRGREVRKTGAEARAGVVCALGGKESEIQELRAAVNKMREQLRAGAPRPT
ncbi:MAG TPA: MarR family transcriptional regulator [Mesorhizobium sp.]|jgi:DNA-binding MarR family transcriptional regulator|nr:MarR family transcriptional regulator [Mesorhizobium sp.]